MIFIPAWAGFGLAAAFLSATMFLLQDRLKVNGYALAFWNKVTCAAIMLPFALTRGFPDDPLFYFYLGLGAVMYAISDVVFYTAIGKEGAGAVSRILPISVIMSFLLWFVIKPSLIPVYLAAPVNSGLIFLTICMTAFFAMRLKKCHVSRRAARAVWFVVFAASVGPSLAKLVTQHAPIGQGPFSYVLCEALMMMSLWSIFLLIRKPVAREIFFSKHSMTGGVMVGCVSAFIVCLNVTAFYYADNPAFVPAIKYMDAVLILAYYKLTKRKSEGDIWSGLGVVACASILIILKSQFL